MPSLAGFIALLKDIEQRIARIRLALAASAQPSAARIPAATVSDVVSELEQLEGQVATLVEAARKPDEDIPAEVIAEHARPEAEGDEGDDDSDEGDDTATPRKKKTPGAAKKK